jgi:hypothetical protein
MIKKETNFKIPQLIYLQKTSKIGTLLDQFAKSKTRNEISQPFIISQDIPNGMK